MPCVYENAFQETDRFLAITLHSLSSIELPVHIFGQYLIHYKTPKSMASVKWIICQLHAVCAFFDLYCTLLISLYIWIPSPAGYPVGLLNYFGLSSTVQIYGGCYSLLAVGFSCIIFFENRYDVIVIGRMRRSENRNRNRLIYFFAYFLYCSASFTYIFAHFPTPDEGRIHVRKAQPCIPTEWINNPNFFIMNMTRTEVVVLTASMFVLFVIQCAYFVFFTVYRLFSDVGNLSVTTRKLQWKFFLALVIQTTVPLIGIASPLLYYLIAWKIRYYNQKYNNYAMITTGFNGLLTTIVMILVHQPYRQAVVAMLTTRTEHRSRIRPTTIAFSE